MYKVNFNTGAGNATAATLEEAKQIARDELAYTQQDITIETPDGEVVTTAKWYGVEPTEEDFVLERIGSYGFYQLWTDELENM
ncbi:hypothetical protein PACILC2_22600 [Paenibacillus cisolokensis]|uniref:Uncharacterized protein n=1 Tax=Paenibacillus cisolokensis TaxID=1658519 RepID=A0ABQ4N697_9BACL|nr:hypothetical protein [Paenibacillus cisolokensis]GIQ63692.1 hypothetical protein PACILC2_22600 [Paenibacillus cisolokensis]